MKDNIDGPSTGFTLYYLTGLSLLLFAIPIQLYANKAPCFSLWLNCR